MGYLIDGNNLMGRTRGIGLSAPNARQRLLRRLADFRNLPGKHPLRITVVFDGAPEPGFPDGSTFQGVRLMYAEPDSTADAVIKRVIEGVKNKQGLTVVTSDRALYSYCRSCGVRAMSGEDFTIRLDSALESAGIEEKGEAPIDDRELEEWMRIFGSEAEAESESEEEPV
jgi:predicted RNA-binding protein with PIN domain